MITKERWELAKGGRSVNAGHSGKIRMEAGLPPEEIAAAMRLIAKAPELLGLLKELLADGQFFCSAIELSCLYGDDWGKRAKLLVDKAEGKA